MDGNKPRGSTTERSAIQKDEGKGLVSKTFNIDWRVVEANYDKPLIRDGNKPGGTITEQSPRRPRLRCTGAKTLHLDVRALEEEAIFYKHHKSIIPSKVMDADWVFDVSPSFQKGQVVLSDKVGKWMIFENKITRDDSGRTALDRKWFTIQKMVKDDKIFQAKVSTGKSNPTAQDEATGVIIVYTKDYTDVKDVVAIARKLRVNFIDLPEYIYYKTDEATLAGHYRVTGSTHVSMYRCDRYGSVDQRGSDGKSWVPV